MSRSFTQCKSMRFDASEFGTSMSEIVAYGTAAVIEATDPIVKDPSLPA